VIDLWTQWPAVAMTAGAAITWLAWSRRRPRITRSQQHSNERTDTGRWPR
jgi:hypothetical protein